MDIPNSLDNVQSARSVLSTFPFIDGKMTLRYLTYNVSGLLSKLDNAAFVNYITSLDFVCLTETYIGNEEDAVTGMPKNDVADSITSRSHNDSTRVERDYEDDNPTWPSCKQRRREHIQTPLVLPVSIPWGPASFLSFGGAASFGL